MRYIVMQDRHPIDDLFRRGLEQAEATPPHRVWEGVVRARDQRRARWWYFGLAAGLLVLVGSVVAPTLSEDRVTNYLSDLRGEAATRSRTITKEPTEGMSADHSSRSLSAEVAAGPSEDVTSRALGTKGTSDHRNNGPAASHGQADNEPAHGTRMAENPEADQDPRLVQPAIAIPRVTADGTAGSGPDGREGPVPTADVAGVLASGAKQGYEMELLSLRYPIHPSIAQTIPQDVRPIDAYVLPDHDLWVAVHGGLLRGDLRVPADDKALGAAWEKALSPGLVRTVGFTLGKSYRNGRGLSVGVEFGTSDQAFDHTNQMDSTVMSIETNVAMLDTTVLVYSVDTFLTVLDQSIRGSGTYRSAFFALPVEGYWHHRMGRWQLGLRAGLAWERHIWWSGPGLERNTLEAPIGLNDARSLPADRRTFDMLTGSVTLDLGFDWNERWSLWAGPTLTRGLLALDGGGRTGRLSDRLGARFRLAYTLGKRIERHDP